jgi:DNA-binding NarL/FixJ family response regulator
MDNNFSASTNTSGAAPARTRVLIVDDEPLFRELLQLFLSGYDRMEVVGVVSCADDALRVAETSQPDVILLDSGPDSVVVARSLKAADPAVGIVMLAAEKDRDRIARATASRRCAWSVLLKENMRDGLSLLRAIDGAAWGLTTTDPALHAPPRRTSAPVLERLTMQQFAVLRDVASGYSDDALATRHGIPAPRLEQVLSAIYRDLHIQTDGREDQRVQAVLTYLNETARTGGD